MSRAKDKRDAERALILAAMQRLGGRDLFARAIADEAGQAPVDHPSPKPLQLMERLIETLVPPGGLVLDPFAGSGTTLRAAKNMGRRAIGVEFVLMSPDPRLLTGEQALRVALHVHRGVGEERRRDAWYRLLDHIDAQADLIRDLEDELGAMTVALRVAGCDLERQADRITQLEGEAAALRDWIADADHQPGCSGRVRPDLCKCGLLEIRPSGTGDEA